jgi:hypothetical protein
VRLVDEVAVALQQPEDAREAVARIEARGDSAIVFLSVTAHYGMLYGALVKSVWKRVVFGGSSNPAKKGTGVSAISRETAL